MYRDRQAGLWVEIPHPWSYTASLLFTPGRQSCFSCFPPKAIELLRVDCAPYRPGLRNCVIQLPIYNWLRFPPFSWDSGSDQISWLYFLSSSLLSPFPLALLHMSTYLASKALRCMRTHFSISSAHHLNSGPVMDGGNSTLLSLVLYAFSLTTSGENPSWVSNNNSTKRRNRHWLWGRIECNQQKEVRLLKEGAPFPACMGPRAFLNFKVLNLGQSH